MRESSFFMFKVVNLICLIKYVFKMSNIIDSIKVSGVTYEIQGSGGGGVPESAFTAYTAATDSRIAENEEVTAAALNTLDEKIDNIDGTATVELTQAQYNALVTAGTVSADTYYIITDAQAGDLTNYYTKTETNTLLGGKADTATTYTKTETDNAITSATSTKQDTLVSGTNIKTINNTSILGSGNIDIQGGGGSDINVVQTTGTSTTDVMSQSAVTNIQQNVITQYGNSYDGQGRTGLWAKKANGNDDDNLSIFATKINGKDIISGGYSQRTRIPVGLSLVETSAITTAITSSSTDAQIPSAKGVYDKFDEVEQVTAAALNTLNDKFGGLSIVKLSQSAYDALSPNYDSNTLYVIVN
jgi:hypothetical protein